MSDETELIAQIRAGREDAWAELIRRYEGRLLAFVNSRLRRREVSEDVVQETFLGFLTSLPNYDETRTPLETFLFTIAGYKLTDVLRKTGRRPKLHPLDKPFDSESGSREPAGPQRTASSLMRSRESKVGQAVLISATLKSLIDGWKRNGEWERLKCMELLFVRGWPNKRVAEALGISEQAVANHKSFVMIKLRRRAADDSSGG